MSKIAGCFRERVFTGWRVIKGIRRKSMEYEKMVLLIRAVDDLLFYEKTAVLVTALESVSLVRFGFVRK